MNDFYEQYKNTKGTYIIKDDLGNVLKKQSFDVNTIGENSSIKVLSIEDKVLKKVKKNFYVTLELQDAKGKVISSNEYMFLIGDQKEASKKFKAMGAEIRERNQTYTYGNYYKFFDKLSGENGKEYETKRDTVKSRGF